MRHLLAAAAILLIASAAAQEAGEPVSIAADADQATTTISEPGTVTLTVSRPGVTGSPADDPLFPLFDPLASADIEVSVTGLAEGWNVGLDPSGFPLGPGESRVVTATITVSPDADATTLDLVFTASMSSPDPSGVFVPAGEASTSVQVVHDDSATRDLLEAIGPGIWAVLGALLVSILVAIFLLVDAKTKVVQMGSPAGEIQLRAGATAEVPFWVLNKSREADRFHLSTNIADPEWRGKMSAAGVTLQATQRQEMAFHVTAGKGAKVGSRVVVRVVAVPDHAPRRVGVLPVTVKVIE